MADLIFVLITLAFFIIAWLYVRACDRLYVDIDLAVEDLIDRLKAGKIYAPDKVGWALENFFQPEKGSRC